MHPADTSGETLPILKKALGTMTLGQRPLTTWVIVANITDEFNQRLDVMHAHDTSTDLRARPSSSVATFAVHKLLAHLHI
jgi:hypothetical protein